MVEQNIAVEAGATKFCHVCLSKYERLVISLASHGGNLQGSERQHDRLRKNCKVAASRRETDRVSIECHEERHEHSLTALSTESVNDLQERRSPVVGGDPH